MAYQFICGYCHKIHDVKIKKEVKKFCNSSCAAKYNNSIRSKESRKKQREKVSKTLKSRKTETRICINCNGEFLADPNNKTHLKCRIRCYKSRKSKSNASNNSSKSRVKISPISGISYIKASNLTGWHSPRKIKSAKLLARAFNFELGNLEAVQKLEDAVKKISNMYHLDGKSSSEIKDALNIEYSEFGMFMTKCLGIKLRDLSESLKNYAKKSGKEITDEKSRYWKDCQFKFDPYLENKVLGFDLLKEHTFYHPINNSNGLNRDHMLSIYYGWENKIDPKIISHPANCHIMLAKENFAKNSSSSILLEELIKRIDNWKEDKELADLKLNIIKQPKSEATKKKLSESIKGMRRYTDGIKTINLRRDEPVPIGFRSGMAPRKNKASL